MESDLRLMAGVCRINVKVGYVTLSTIGIRTDFEEQEAILDYMAVNSVQP